MAHGKKPGRTTILTSAEEESFVQYLLYMGERGFPLIRTMVKAFAWSIAKCSNNDRFSLVNPIEHWWQLFKKRYPLIVLRKSDCLERVPEYFDMLRYTLIANHFTNSHRQIYNCDETFLPMDYTREKIVAA